jgi:hypothetical protein
MAADDEEKLPPDDSPERKLEANLSREDPEGREEREPPPPTYEVTEEGED